MDKRAVKILFDAYWSPQGWKSDSTVSVSPEDFAYAKTQGVMFEPITVEHDETLNRVRTAIARLDCRRVADAFLASLSSHRLDLRSALGSFAIFRHVPQHDPSSDNEGRCEICGLYLSGDPEDLNVLNFERLKWGGVRHDNPIYAAMDLELFLREAPQPPGDEDVRLFRAILAAIEAAPLKETSALLHKRFAKILKSNKAERDVIVAILGFCGVLETADHPGFSKSFIPASSRTLPDRHFVDMPYPACWWRRDAGINRDAVHEYFGHVL
jgi:hypothetical protein